MPKPVLAAFVFLRESLGTHFSEGWIDPGENGYLTPSGHGEIKTVRRDADHMAV